MKRRILGAGLFCLLLFGAIIAGYWDMLSTEKLTIVRDKASQSVGEIADVVRKRVASSEKAATEVDPALAKPAPPAGGKESRPVPAMAPQAPANAPESPAAPAAPASAAKEAPAEPPRTEVASAPPAAVAPTPAGPEASPAEGASPKGPSDPTTGLTPGASEAPKEQAAPAVAAAPVPAAPVAAAPVPAAPVAPADTAPEPMTLPTFDIVRVEPDGSTVLAGRAPAGSAIALLDGKTRIGGDTASAGGDFVVALDQRLEVGEHQLTLEATAPDGRATTSAETAIVSIPEKGRENELLAMVETPDKPSRLISIPTAPSPEPKEPRALAATRAAPDAPTVAEPPPAAPADSPLLPSASQPAAEGAGLTLPEKPRPAPALPATALAVEAVEIEGERIFIAGRAAGIASVRAYIDNEFLAAAPKITADRFLITANAPVRPGEHMVRADALDAAGAVVARVEVPFNRPEGRAMSAIAAPPEPAAAKPAPATAEPAAAPAPATAPAEVPPAPTAPIEAPAAVASAAPEAPSPPVAAASPPAPPADAAAGIDPATDGGDRSPSAEASPGDDIAVIRQPALETVGSRVIIRRGDTLWRISRDTYGYGARYTVIYLANGDQIRDPDRIYPGQVFRMPRDETEAAKPASGAQ